MHPCTSDGGACLALQHLAVKQALLERPEPINHQYALEMIVLVLDGYGQETFRFQLEPFSVAVLGLYADLLRPVNLLSSAGEAQASLVERQTPLEREDLGIDEHSKIAGLALGRAVHHEDLPGLAELRRREPDAGAGLHRLRHVVDELAQLGRDRRDPLAGLSQALVGVVQDGANGHGPTNVIRVAEGGESVPI